MTASAAVTTAHQAAPSALQSNIQARTDLFSLINGGSGFAALLENFDIVRAPPVPRAAQPAPESEQRASADPGDAGASAADQAPADKVPAALPGKSADRSDERAAPDERDAPQAAMREAASAATPDRPGADAQDSCDHDAAQVAMLLDEDAETKIGNEESSADTALLAAVFSQQAQTLSPRPAAAHNEAPGAALAVQTAIVAASATASGEAHQDALHLVAGLTPIATGESAAESTPGTAIPDAKAVTSVGPIAANAFAGFDTSASDADDQTLAYNIATQADTDAAQRAAADDGDGAPPALTTSKAGAFMPGNAAALVQTASHAPPMPGAAPAQTDLPALKLLDVSARNLQGYNAAAQLTAPKDAKASALAAPRVIEQVAVKLNHSAKLNLDQLTIQLRPADLGRIDVKLEFHDGAVTGLVLADTQQTLDMLAKDSRSLERALQDAGLRADPGALSFQLRDSGGRAAEQQHDGRSAAAASAFTGDILVEDGGATETSIIEPTRINMRV